MKVNFRRSGILPLLNFEAYGEGDYELSVSLKFEHKGSIFHLVRESKPKPSQIRNPDKIELSLTLNIDGRTVLPQLIKSTIEEIIPQRISKFFFVEVDSINQYSALLFAGETTGAIVEDIEAILGMPALEYSKSDFSLLKRNKTGN